MAANNTQLLHVWSYGSLTPAPQMVRLTITEEFQGSCLFREKIYTAAIHVISLECTMICRHENPPACCANVLWICRGVQYVDSMFISCIFFQGCITLILTRVAQLMLFKCTVTSQQSQRHVCLHCSQRYQTHSTTDIHSFIHSSVTYSI